LKLPLSSEHEEMSGYGIGSIFYNLGPKDVIPTLS